MKMNSLTDRQVIDALSEASCAGVPIFLLIRGICCIRPGVLGKTENIHVESIVGRFLEHSRIYCFGIGEEMKIYISSADMTTRNTRRRVEIACPIYDPVIRERIKKMIFILKKDNVQASMLQADGEYILKDSKEEKINSQLYFLRDAKNHRQEPKVKKKNLLELLRDYFHQK